MKSAEIQVWDPTESVRARKLMKAKSPKKTTRRIRKRVHFAEDTMSAPETPPSKKIRRDQTPKTQSEERLKKTEQHDTPMTQPEETPKKTEQEDLPREKRPSGCYGLFYDELEDLDDDEEVSLAQAQDIQPPVVPSAPTLKIVGLEESYSAPPSISRTTTAAAGKYKPATPSRLRKSNAEWTPSPASTLLTPMSICTPEPTKAEATKPKSAKPEPTKSITQENTTEVEVVDELGFTPSDYLPLYSITEDDPVVQVLLKVDQSFQHEFDAWDGIDRPVELLERWKAAIDAVDQDAILAAHAAAHAG